MELVARKLGERSRDRHSSRETRPPDWLQNYEELTPYNDDEDPQWWKLRSGITSNGYIFNMTENEFIEIYRGTLPTYKDPGAFWKPEATQKLYTYLDVVSYFSSKDCRSLVVRYYNELINYFDQLDFSNPEELDNFEEWKTWWRQGLDLVIPKWELMNKFDKVYYKDGYSTKFDELRLVNLAARIYPLPDFPTRPPMLDLSSPSRTP
jgi:hypothetical protein